ncbi:hypothetical protein [Rhizobium sp. CF142]|uniref:hypothetical protein n=1 Tax=Rhizobium sp. CF142 TaxID=1144314 RepID=UPI00055A8A2B|nr:hypothetical protein [Rhizobium sp. CF142]
MPDLIQTFFVSIMGGLATGITGLVGLSFTQRYTDNRKLIDATLNEIENVAEACAKAAGEAWSKVGDPSAPDVSETVCLLHEIASFISFIKDRVPGSALRLDAAHLNFRRAASGDDFDVKDRPADLGRVSEIRSSKASLKMACRAVIYERNRLGIPFISGD